MLNALLRRIRRPLPPIEAELVEDETLLWSGQPSTQTGLNPKDVMWFAILAVIVVFSTLIDGYAPVFFCVLMVVFFFYAMKPQATTHYAVTNRRIIITAGMLRARTLSIPLLKLNAVIPQEFSRGIGILYFSRNALAYTGPVRDVFNGGFQKDIPSQDNLSMKQMMAVNNRCFSMIENVNEVAEIIRQAKLAADTEANITAGGTP